MSVEDDIAPFPSSAIVRQGVASRCVNEDEFESLRRWGESLGDDPRPEVRAAGKAIHLLAREVDRLQVELWHSRIGVVPVEENGEPVADAETTMVPGAEPALEQDLQSTFSRVARRLHAPRVFHRS
jgi:hypothetical protein